MDEMILEKSRLEEILRELMKNFTVFGPVSQDEDFVLFKIDSPDKIRLNYQNFKLSPKGLFFPQTESLFTFGRDGIIGETEFKEERLILGVRPCDAQAFVLLDQVFQSQDFNDPYYANRRQRTLIITLACNKPCPTCFCTSILGSPQSEKGSDLCLWEIGNKYLVKPVTEKGRALFNHLVKFFRPATRMDLDEKKIIMDNSVKRISNPFQLETLKSKLDGLFDAPFWDEFSMKCLGCGICTYFCPTCHCFDITDEVLRIKEKRIRTWDSCMFPLFTLQASGYNPRPTRKERTRQRIMHKFNYCLKNFNQTFCVGCGRCIINCPVNLDLRRVLSKIEKWEY